ncbi:hypothetical protein MTO96_023883 [Rhipicephalus appendiculatus]
MTYSQKLVIHVSVAAVLALFSAVTEVKAAEFQGDYDDLKEELKVLRRKVNDLEHHCKVLDMGMAEVPGELKELKSQVKALQNKGKNTESNSIHPVPGMSIGEVYKKVLEIDEKLESEKKSLREAVERMERDIESERLERNISMEAARAEARSVTELLAPEVKRTLVELPSMMAEMKRFDRTGRYIVQLLSPARSQNETADKDKLNSVQFEGNSIAVPKEETNEPTTESDAEVYAVADDRRSNVPRHSPQQNFNINDAADCPGLDVLAGDDRLVLSTHNSGRYRAPHLPSYPLPVGSVVRFRCVPAGSHKLIGAAEIRCLGAKRWSSKPPRCHPLLTLDQIMDFAAGNTTNMTPSILYDKLVDDELASADDSDNLVVRLGANLRLKCLYPRKRGNVTWLHNGTFPSDAALAWVKEGPADLGENAYVLEINRTSPEHSGTYRCETSEGTNHSITIKILDHFSLPEGSCLRPVVPDGFSVSPDKDWYETGTRISYSCQGGKLLVGMPNAICHEGQWMGKNRRCF